jgi:hypothetical protein
VADIPVCPVCADKNVRATLPPADLASVGANVEWGRPRRPPTQLYSLPGQARQDRHPIPLPFFSSSNNAVDRRDCQSVISEHVGVLQTTAGASAEFVETGNRQAL